jgi:hypothetical protein
MVDRLTARVCIKNLILRCLVKFLGHPFFPATALAYILSIIITFLTVIGLTPGGSSTVHIYTQTPDSSSTVHIYTQTPGGSSTVHIYTQTPDSSSTVHIYTQTPGGSSTVHI